MKKWIIGVCLALIAGCASQGSVTNFETEGNLESKNPLACVKAEAVKPSDTAADITAGAVQCVEQSNYELASELVFVANAFAYFDTQRVTDRSAHAALSALFAVAFANFSDDEQQKLFAEIENLSSSSPRSQEICRFLISAPPPDYYPQYMIAHGLQAFGNSSNAPLLVNFNSKLAWMSSLEFVDCDSLPIVP